MCNAAVCMACYVSAPEESQPKPLHIAQQMLITHVRKAGTRCIYIILKHISRNGPYIRVFFFLIVFQTCFVYSKNRLIIMRIFHEMNIKHPFTKMKTNKLISTMHKVDVKSMSSAEETFAHVK